MKGVKLVEPLDPCSNSIGLMSIHFFYYILTFIIEAYHSSFMLYGTLHKIFADGLYSTKIGRVVFI